jgi:putative nucleotidyltransferase with HDIG domain
MHTATQDRPVRAQEMWILRLRAVAPDVQYPKLLPYLQRALDAQRHELKSILGNLPVQLRVFADKEAARKHQLALSSLGAVALTDRAQMLGDWLLEEVWLQQFRSQMRWAMDGEVQLLYAMLRCDQPQAPWRLAQACSRSLDEGYQVLNSTDIVLKCPMAGEQGAAAWLAKVQRELVSKLGGEMRFASAMAICPDDGTQVEQVLAKLSHRIEARASWDAKRSAAAPPFVRWPLAGELWRECVSLGPLRSREGLPEETVRWLRDSWPVGIEQDWNHVSMVDERILEQRNALLIAYANRQDSRRRLREELLQRLETVSKVPTLPTHALEIYKLAQDRDYDTNTLAAIVERDPGLSTRVLAVVNSPHFGLASTVDSIRHALVLLGGEEIAHIALSVSTETVFSQLKSRAGAALWKHSFKVAEISRSLARRVDPALVPMVFTAGLLHDVGKVCLYVVASREMQECETRAQELCLPSMLIERSQLGIDHAELGGLMLARWGLPQNLIETVNRHHGVWPGDSALPLSAALIGLADHMAHRLDDSDNAGDEMRLSQCQLRTLSPHLGMLDGTGVDLLAQDVREGLGQQAA